MNDAIGDGYGADQVRALEGLEAVRLRPGMYVGSTGKSGFHHLLWEVVDNSVDEAMGGHASTIEVTLNEDGSATCVDDGRGIPIDPQTNGLYKGTPTVEMVLTVLHAGGKFDQGAYQFSGGLHGVGVSVVNALSEWTEVQVRRDGYLHEITFGVAEIEGKTSPVAGAVINPLRQVRKIHKSDTGTTVTFLPDERVFTHRGWDLDLIARRLRQGAFLNPGLTFVLHDHRDPDDYTTVTYHYPNGLIDFMAEQAEDRLAQSDHEGETELLLPVEPIVMGGIDERISGEWNMVMRWYPDPSYYRSSFANGIETSHGGAHVKGYEQVLTMLLNRYARQDHIGLLGDKDPSLEAADSRSGLGVIISVKVKDPQFVGQTKDELSNDETRQMVREGFSNQFWSWMESHPTETKALLTKCIDSMRLRHKLADMERSERERTEKRGYAPKSQALPPKLNDCSTRSRMDAELFIVEGDSAAGPTIKARDSRTQAVLPIRGKGLNIERALSARDGADRIANNKEVQGIIATLGAGSQDLFDLDSVRYGKIILLTDADDDGRHIQLLLMTLFYRLMPDMVRDGRLYVARPPLFSTSRKGEKIYLSDETELEGFLDKHPRHPDPIIRFKGLGEMDTYQLRETAVSPDTRRLARITVEDDSIADATLTQLMGNDADAKWEVLQSVVMDESLV